MGSIKRLGLAYLGVGFLIALVENWTAQTRGAPNIFNVLGSSVSAGDKARIVLDVLVMPILAWPFHVLALIRGG